MSRILERYVEIFPPSLFLCSDDSHSMHFILSLKHLTQVQQDELVDLLNHCGSELSFDVEDASDYSAVIVDHDEIVSVKAPAFTLNYFEDCFKNMKLQNISEYRQDSTRHIARNVQCMDVVYFRKKSWDSVLTDAEKQWFADINSSKPTERSELFASPNLNDITSLVNRRLIEQEDNLLLKEGNSKTINGCKLSSDGDSDLGDTENRVTENLPNKKEETNKNKLNKKTENPKLTKESSNSIKSLDLNSKGDPALPTTSKWNILDSDRSEDFFTVKDNKHSRMPYSYEEQSRVLKYIRDHGEFSRLKGRDLWIVMERRKICPNRTWQSMKEHFLKKISSNLEAFDFLTNSDKLKIKQGLC